jgi:hypothetical protein
VALGLGSGVTATYRPALLKFEHEPDFSWFEVSLCAAEPAGRCRADLLVCRLRVISIAKGMKWIVTSNDGCKQMYTAPLALSTCRRGAGRW